MSEDGEQRSKGPSMGSGHQLRFISWWECPVLRCGLRVSEIAVMRSPASEASVQLSECHCINIYAVTGLGPVISLWTGNGRVTTSGQSGIPWPPARLGLNNIKIALGLSSGCLVKNNSNTMSTMRRFIMCFESCKMF